MLGSESKSLLLTDVLSDVEQFNFSGQMDFHSSVVTIAGDCYLLWNKSEEQSSICNTKSLLGSNSDHGSFVGYNAESRFGYRLPQCHFKLLPPC